MTFFLSAKRGSLSAGLTFLSAKPNRIIGQQKADSMAAVRSVFMFIDEIIYFNRSIIISFE